MKLLRIGEPGAELPGVLRDDGSVVDVSALVADYVPSFFAGGGPTWLRERIPGRDLPVLAVENARIGPPIGRPHKLVCIGLNYADHAAESGQPAPVEPVIFSKATNTIVGPNDDVLIPRRSSKTDWEVELAVVIGAPARYLNDETEAMACVAGYTISNDVSEREFQLERGGQWVKGKSCETFNPLGPWLVTPDEAPDATEFELTLSLNGAVMQSGHTKNMIFGVAHLIWYLSQFLVLEPGDVINTGTPAGVGMGRTPPQYAQPGDVADLTITGLGRQRHAFRPVP